MDDTYWNYRILKRKAKEGKPYYGLAEVYYEHDRPIGWTESDFVACDEDEGSEGIVRTLMLMLKDAQKHAVLDEQELWDSLPFTQKSPIYPVKNAPDAADNAPLYREGPPENWYVGERMKDWKINIDVEEQPKSIFSDKDAVEKAF